MTDAHTNLLFMNIGTLIKKTGIKIGDVEKGLGVSAGYFSRVAKKQYKANISIDFLNRVSRFFDVSIDALLNANFEKFTAQETYLLNLVCKLIKLTESGEIYWKGIFTEITNSKEFYKDSEVLKNNPLFKQDYIDILLNQINYNVDIVYASRFFKDKLASPYQYVFSTTIEDVGELCLVHSNLLNKESQFDLNMVYELYLIDRKNNEAIPICCTSPNKDFDDEKIRLIDFEVFIPKLYDAVKKKVETPDFTPGLYDFVIKFNTKFSNNKKEEDVL